MSAYKCANCPETMYSKCPSERTIFPENQYVTAFQNTLLKELKPYREGSSATCLNIEWGCAGPEDETTAAEMFEGFVRRIRDFTDEEIKILLCNHKWYLEEGQTCDLSNHSHDQWRPKVEKAS